VISSLVSECGKKRKSSYFFLNNDDYSKLVNLMNKRQGRKISRMLRNKSMKSSNVSSLVEIEDDEFVKNQEVYYPRNISSHIMEETPEKVVEEFEKGKSKVNTNLDVSFWKDKYYLVVLVLQENLIDLELRNQLIIE
jgi:signal recognition particle subunit SEC65